MPLRAQKDTHGRTIGYEFEPSLKMLRVVVECNKAENLKLSTDDILEKCRVTKREWERWWTDYVIVDMDPDGNATKSTNYFEIWYDDALQIKSGEIREMLLHAGIQRALTNDSKAHHYWTPLAKQAGLISNEAAEKPKVISFDLGGDEVNLDDIATTRRKLLEANRGVGDARGTGMARLTSKRSKS